MARWLHFPGARVESDGLPKTPEWQEAETGVPARDVRALAREWGTKKTYLGAGSWGVGVGGACRTATGMQWARMMTILGAMQGWGRPGVNFGNLQFGSPLDYSFYFPGYGEGTISGDLAFSANSANNYQRMPHIVTMNSVRQSIPRIWFPEAITTGKAAGYITDPRWTPQNRPSMDTSKPAITGGVRDVVVD